MLNLKEPSRRMVLSNLKEFQELQTQIKFFVEERGPLGLGHLVAPKRPHGLSKLLAIIYETRAQRSLRFPNLRVLSAKYLKDFQKTTPRVIC